MRNFRFRRIAFICSALTMLVLFIGCRMDAGIGGPLPTLASGSFDEPDGDVLLTPAPVSAPSRAQSVNETPLTIQPEASGIGDDLPVSRALAAKMLTLTFNDMNTIDAMDYEINFSDVERGAWYAKYINAAFVQGIMSGTGAEFLPDEPLTLGQAHSLLSSLDPAHKPGIALSDENRDRPVSYALWVALYKKLLEGASDGRTIYETFGIEGANIIVLSTAGNNTTLSDGQMITDAGVFSHRGVSVEAYVDKEIRVFYKNKEIIALVSQVNEAPTLKNAYVMESDKQGVSVFCGGARRYYAYAPGCAALTEDTNSGICDVVINNGEAVSVVLYTETVTGTVLRTTGDGIELKEHGFLPLDSRFKTYSIADGAPKWKSFTNLLVGADMATFYVDKGTLRAGVITKTVEPNRIRVSIGTSNYAGLIHKNVTVTSDGDFTVTAGETVVKLTSGQRFSVSDIENTDLFGAPRLYIQSDLPGGTLVLSGLKRNWTDGASPRYRGVIEIAREEGGYTVVNELGMEEYLYAVVPSEMPSSYGAEASKAQAVAARSYAYNQFYENRFHAYGGNVDDSVSCQVYNNIPENTTSIEAVDATRGQCLTYKGSVITANFFSTSSGMTANNGEVWAAAGVFPSQSGAYLKAAPQYEGNTYGDLTLEENAAVFFKDTSVDAYDGGISWFRWNVHMTAEEIAASVNHSLSARYAAAPSLIKTQQANGTYRSRPVEAIGDLVDIAVIRRGEGGNIMEMCLTGTEAIISVCTEYNVRALLSPAKQNETARDITLNRADGSTIANYSLMPSAFFVMEKEMDENGQLTGVTFYGGGMGHGVGMSQNGVKGMTDRGFTFEEALFHYYPGTEITTMFQ